MPQGDQSKYTDKRQREAGEKKRMRVNQPG